MAPFIMRLKCRTKNPVWGPLVLVPLVIVFCQTSAEKTGKHTAVRNRRRDWCQVPETATTGTKDLVSLRCRDIGGLCAHSEYGEYLQARCASVCRECRAQLEAEQGTSPTPLLLVEDSDVESDGDQNEMMILGIGLGALVVVLVAVGFAIAKIRRSEHSNEEIADWDAAWDDEGLMGASEVHIGDQKLGTRLSSGLPTELPSHLDSRAISSESASSQNNNVHFDPSIFNGIGTKMQTSRPKDPYLNSRIISTATSVVSQGAVTIHGEELQQDHEMQCLACSRSFPPDYDVVAGRLICQDCMHLEDKSQSPHRVRPKLDEELPASKMIRLESQDSLQVFEGRQIYDWDDKIHEGSVWANKYVNGSWEGDYDNLQFGGLAQQPMAMSGFHARLSSAESSIYDWDAEDSVPQARRPTQWFPSEGLTTEVLDDDTGLDTWIGRNETPEYLLQDSRTECQGYIPLSQKQNLKSSSSTMKPGARTTHIQFQDDDGSRTTQRNVEA
eukprot:m.12595 g.12595  ORF g.12595 m.12595 type:complete len:499 (-) comp4678_c0_seq1:155-1651(-)